MPRVMIFTLASIALFFAPVSIQAQSPLVIGSSDRPALRGGTSSCGSIRFLVNSEDTGGAFSIVESNECGKPVTDLHMHPNMDESFYVAEGALTIYVDGETQTLAAGSYFFVPRGTWHAQGNPCNVPNKVLVTFTPGGFERYLRDRTEVLRTTTLGSAEFLAAMAARGHGGRGRGGGNGQNNRGLAPIGEIACPPK